MAVVLSPSLSFHSLPGQQIQTTHSYKDIGFPVEPLIQQKPRQQLDLFSTDIDLCLDSLFSNYWFPVQEPPKFSCPSLPVYHNTHNAVRNVQQPVQTASTDLYDMDLVDSPEMQAIEPPMASNDTSMEIELQSLQCDEHTIEDELTPTSQLPPVDNVWPFQNRMPGFDRISGPRTSFDDVLFSSLRSDVGSTVHKLGNLCSLCRHPFESREEHALIKHFSNHSKDLQGGFTCGTCNADFAFKADLEWHSVSCNAGSRRGRRRTRGHIESFLNHGKKIAWEWVQLKAHSKEVDFVLERKRRPKRSSSVPSADRKTRQTLADGNLHGHRAIRPMKTFAEPYNAYGRKMETPDDDCNGNGRCLQLKPSILDIEKRITSLTERICAAQDSPPNSQILTPDSGFSDSTLVLDVNTPNTNFSEGEQDDFEVTVPFSPANFGPDQCADNSESASFKEKAPYYASTSGTGRGGSFMGHGSYSTKVGQKRRSNDQDDAADGNSNGEDRNCDSKRRKMGSGDMEDDKKFPCICHIGEPQRFANDTARHRHISNMCRHLKSHAFYACPTCILQFPNEEELTIHFGCHIRNCRKKGCRRQRPAFEPEPTHCSHITSSEEQWREMFALKYDREPPNVFGGGVSTPDRHQAGESSLLHNVDMPDAASELPNQITVEGENELSLSSEFNFDDFVFPPDSDGLYLTSEASRSQAMPSDEFASTQKPGSVTEDTSFLKLVENLQKQVTSLEKKLEDQATGDKDRIHSLQAQVTQLEEKLYKSSEREEQLEATLGVIFDAFQATGAPQAQPGKPLSKLVQSHSPQAAASFSVNSQFVEAKGAASSPTGSVEMCRSISNNNKKKPERADSAYGSLR